MPILKIDSSRIPQVVEFINQYYSTGFGSFIRIQPEFCQKVLDHGEIYMNQVDEDIVATMFIHFITPNLVTCSHLVVEEDSRDEGYARDLIQHVRSKYPSLPNYRLVFVKTSPGLKVNVYYRPLNIQKCESNGYYFEEFRNNRLKYLVKKPNVTIKQCTPKDFSHFSPYPLPTSIFTVCSVYDKTNLVGVFAYLPITLYSSKYGKTIQFASASLVKAVDDAWLKVVLKSLYHHALSNHCIFCYIYELNNINIEVLKQTMAFPVENSCYIEYDHWSPDLANFHLLLV